MNKLNKHFMFDDCGPRDFIRKYALRIFDYDALKLGLLLSCGDPMEQAFTYLGITPDDLPRARAAIQTLINIGFVRKIEHVADDNALLDDGSVVDPL